MHGSACGPVELRTRWSFAVDFKRGLHPRTPNSVYTEADNAEGSKASH
jgi:hypothetical protein